ncbi:MAG: RidA family protein [Anaerolineae bacterium]
MPETNYITTPYSYSAAVDTGEYVFLGLHRAGGDTFLEQLRGTFAGAAGTLAQCGLPLTSLVKITVWLKDIDDLPAMEQAVLDYFPAGRFPARMTAVTPFIDADCLVMIEGIAYRGE